MVNVQGGQRAALTVHRNNEVGFFKTCINGINALSGIGILSVPYALSSGGWLSVVIFLIIAIAACFTGLLIRKCMDTNTDITTYSDVAGHAFGKKGRLIASIFTCLELYSVATGLVILEGDNLLKLSPDFALKFGGISLDGRHSFIVVAGVMIMPSMFLNNLDALSYVSAGGIISSLIILICVFTIGLNKEIGFHGKGTLLNLNGLPTAISLYTFCYGAHAVFPPIYTSMKHKNQFPKVLLISFVICTITYILMAILGFLIYGQDVQSQVTLNLPTRMVSSKVAIYTILATPIAKYALIVIPIASVIEERLPPSYQAKKPINILIRMCLLASTVLLAIVFPSFQTVASLSGALLVVMVSFILPCLCYLKMFQLYKNWGFELVGIVVVMVMSGFVAVLGTYSTVAQNVKA